MIQPYLRQGKFFNPSIEVEEAKTIDKFRKCAAKYIFMSEKLYKIGKTTLMLCCLGEHQIPPVLAEVDRKAYGRHIGG